MAFGLTWALAAILGCGSAAPKANELDPGNVAKCTKDAAVQSQYERSCLLGMLDQYLAGLSQGDATDLPVATGLRSTENGVATALDAGLWKTQVSLGTFRQDFADSQTGQVGTLVVIQSDAAPALLALRLKVTEGRIAESEIIVTRSGQAAFFAPQNLTMAEPVFDELLPADQKLSREKLVAVVDGYFDGIVRNDATGIEFDPMCHRVENGVETAKSPNIGAQFPIFSYIKRIDRRILVVDEERGLVWGVFVFQVPGESIYAPRTTFVSELFKVTGGAFLTIHAFLLNTPYGTPTGW
ncbi:MAG: hypothetical protein RL385_2739 [Pseudomonadota bacterium]|jgi:hypothetical protein